MSNQNLNKQIIKIFIFLLAATLSLSVTAQSKDSNLNANVIPASGKSFKLGAGDELDVFVWKHPTFSMSVTVGPDGKINYPLVGEIYVEGSTQKEVEKAIENGLRKQLRSPTVNVTLNKVLSYRVYVIGEVIQPGVFVLKGPVTVLQALSMAGGFTPFASRNDIVVYNPKAGSSQRLIFDYDKFVSDDDQNDVVLKPGDTVIVR